MSAAENKAVFLSYASQDAAAAQRICDALRSAGVEVWFDQSELVGGDVWDAKIRKQIAECALFVPVISAATQARTEGYFRLEWKLAAQRTHMIADDAAFLLPVVIDVTRDAEARVPAEFKSVQWTRFAGAETPVAFCERVKHLLSGSAALQPALDTPERGLKPRATPKMGRTPRAWLGWAVGATTAVALLGTLGWKLLRHDEGSPRPSEAARLSAPPISEGPTAPLTEARKLTLQARALIDDDPLAVRQNYLLAEELCKKAVVLDVSDAEAWATYARVSLAFWDWGYDDTPRRREAARSQSQRAIRLAPDSIEAGLAEAGLTLLSRPPTQPGDEPEPRLRALLRQAPGDKRVYRLLANTLSRVGRAEEASALRLQSAALPGGDSQALSDDASPFTGSVFNHWVSDRMFDRVFAATPTKTAYHARLVMRIHSLGDLEAARTFLATIPEQLMTEDLFAAQAFILWLRLGEPEKALAALSRVPRDFLEERRQKYPRATLEGLAHALAGRSAAATVKWTEALRLVEQRMTTDSNQSVWIFHRALLLALLGKKEAAREQLDAFRQLGAFAEFLGANGGTPVVLLLLGDTEAAIAEFQGQVAQGQRSRMLVLSALRFDPLLKPIRDDPRVQTMIQEGLARLESQRLAAGDAARSSGAAPLPTDSAPAKSAPADKSVAVLAFKNLSGDPSREFFSDGLSEAVTDVLGRVPGLKVIGSTSAFAFKGRSVPIPEIARQLGVTHLVEGTVQEVGQEVRVTAKLIQADGFKVGVPVNARREVKNIFDLYDEVAGLIAKDFSLNLGVSSVASQAPVNPEAFELFLRARQGMERRLVAGAGQTLANLAQIERWLKRALELEPRFARAHALLADVWIGRLFYPRPSERMLQDESHSAEIARIRAKIAEALALDPDAAEVHASHGNLFARLGQHSEAEAAYRRATALNPSYARAHAALGRELSVLVRVDQAEMHSKLATELDPLSPITWGLLGYRMLRARRTHDAIRAFDRALSLEPGSVLGIIGKICALFELGRRDEAVALVQRVPADDARNASIRFYCFARAGLKAEAEALYAAFRSGDGRDSSFQWVGGLIALGRADEALALLTRQGFNHSDAGDYIWDAVFDPVRGDPRWVKIIAEAGLTEAHARAQAWRAAHPAQKPAAVKP